MTNAVVVGIQWGDEGKGKIVDWISESMDIVARFQGGNNAGHTLVVDGEVFKLSLLPSGVLRKGKIGVIGNGVVLDPWSLAREIASIANRGVPVTAENLVIADNACLILPVHKQLDAIREEHAGKAKIGTTSRGIGPAYEDRVGRRSIRVVDLGSRELLNSAIDRLLSHHDPLRRGLGLPPVNREELLRELEEIAPRILCYAKPVWQFLDTALKNGKRILFEGAQGALLDIDHGTYPFVTSSSTVPGSAAGGTGTGANSLGYLLGVCKAYQTRVGRGPFPTELEGEMGAHFQSVGNERGTVTGRPRRCGWFDAALTRQTCILTGVNGIALTKIDVLDGLPEIKVCVGYSIDGERFEHLPSDPIAQIQAKPLYEGLPGWKESTAGIRTASQLPTAAISYIHRIEELVGRTINYVSTSPEREDTVILDDPLLLR